MPSYFTATNNYLYLFKSIEKRGVKKPVFQNYFKANQIPRSGDHKII